MGLGGGSVKVRYGKDPRNTAWSNDTNRFGHKHMEKLGWQPGNGLGLGSTGQRAMTSHVKVSVKTDNTGLGKKSEKKDGINEMDGEVTTGLDTFQRLLGKLNGKSDEQVQHQMQDQRARLVMNNPRFGMIFVHGGVLEGSVEKWLEADEAEKKSKRSKKHKSKKRKRDEDSGDSDDEDQEQQVTEKRKKNRMKGKKKKSKSDDSDDGKKERKQKKKEKKEKKEKRRKAESSSSDEEPEKSKHEPVLRGRLATRMKFIAQKRAATADSKALNEILMMSKA